MFGSITNQAPGIGGAAEVIVGGSGNQGCRCCSQGQHCHGEGSTDLAGVRNGDRFAKRSHDGSQRLEHPARQHSDFAGDGRNLALGEECLGWVNGTPEGKSGLFQGHGNRIAPDHLQSQWQGKHGRDSGCGAGEQISTLTTRVAAADKRALASRVKAKRCCNKGKKHHDKCVALKKWCVEDAVAIHAKDQAPEWAGPKVAKLERNVGILMKFGHERANRHAKAVGPRCARKGDVWECPWSGAAVCAWEASQRGSKATGPCLQSQDNVSGLVGGEGPCHLEGILRKRHCL